MNRELIESLIEQLANMNLNDLLGELLLLQKETKQSIAVMIEKAIRRYVDSEKSDGYHAWVDGVKYPIPDRLRVP